MDREGIAGMMGEEHGKSGRREEGQVSGGCLTQEPGLTPGTLEGFQQATHLVRYTFLKDISGVA